MLHLRFFVACAIVPLAVTSTGFAQSQQFQPLSRMTISTDADSAFGIAVGDVNRDGAVDYVVANLNGTQQSRLYINDGNGNFTDMSATLLPSALPAGSVVMGDIDRDGDLDIILGTQPSTCTPSLPGKRRCSTVGSVRVARKSALSQASVTSPSRMSKMTIAGT